MLKFLCRANGYPTTIAGVRGAITIFDWLDLLTDLTVSGISADCEMEYNVGDIFHQ